MNREEMTRRAAATLKARKKADEVRRYTAYEATAKKRANQEPTAEMLRYLESLMEAWDLGIAYLKKGTGREIRSVSDLNFYEAWKIIGELKSCSVEPGDLD